MLESLSITNFVIVDQLELNFDAGFTALTGETGAGKSILIDALSLALGSRSETGIVRNGYDKSEISATFNIVNNHDATKWLNENDIETEGGLLGTKLGPPESVGLELGWPVGAAEMVGFSDGIDDGCADTLGDSDGMDVGTPVSVGLVLGPEDG